MSFLSAVQVTLAPVALARHSPPPKANACREGSRVIALKLTTTTRGGAMIEFWSKLPAVLSRMVLAIVFLSWFSVFADADTNCTGKCATGHSDCIGWCLFNNRTTKSGEKCQARCDAYWYSGKNPQSIGRSDPHPSGPPRKVDPGKLKNPPTTVSNPNAPTQSPPQIRERQHR